MKLSDGKHGLSKTVRMPITPVLAFHILTHFGLYHQKIFRCGDANAPNVLLIYEKRITIYPIPDLTIDIYFIKNVIFKNW